MREKSARGPLPKKIIFSLFIREELLVIFDFFVIINRVEIAFIVHFEESFFIIFNVIDEEDAVEMIDLMEKDAGEGTFGFDADFGAIFEESFDAGFFRTFN